MLTHSLTKRLVFEENLYVLLCIVLSFQILLSFIGVFRIPNTIQVSKRIRCLLIIKSACSLNKRRKWLRTFWLFTLLVLVLWIFYRFTSMSALKWSFVGNLNRRPLRSAAPQLVVVSTWIYIRIIYAVWNQRAESLVWTFRRIHNDTFDFSNFRSFFPYESVTHKGLLL